MRIGITVAMAIGLLGGSAIAQDCECTTDGDCRGPFYRNFSASPWGVHDSITHNNGSCNNETYSHTFKVTKTRSVTGSTRSSFCIKGTWVEWSGEFSTEAGFSGSYLTSYEESMTVSGTVGKCSWVKVAVKTRTSSQDCEFLCNPADYIETYARHAEWNEYRTDTTSGKIPGCECAADASGNSDNRQQVGARNQ